MDDDRTTSIDEFACAYYAQAIFQDYPFVQFVERYEQDAQHQILIELESAHTGAGANEEACGSEFRQNEPIYL